MKEVKGMEKNSRVGGDSKNAYNGTKDQDVKEVFNEAMAKNGLCILTIDIEEDTQVDRWVDPKYQNQKQSVFTKVKTKYLLLHESGESQTICGYGHGVDPQDKGAGKATTYALKNALLYTFLTPVGKIDDTETTHSDDVPVPEPEPFAGKLKPSALAQAVDRIVSGEDDLLDKLIKSYKLTEVEISMINKSVEELIPKDGATNGND